MRLQIQLFILFAAILICILLCTVFPLTTNNTKNTANAENTENSVAFLVHTFDGYQRYWPGFLYFFFKYHKPKWPVYFASEEVDGNDSRCIPILTEKGPWGKRLLTALSVIPETHIIYMQEDIWLTAELDQDYLDAALENMTRDNLNCLKLQDDCKFHVGMPDDVSDRRWYIISHHPGMWKKSFLSSTLSPEMSPFQHETRANFALHTSRQADAQLCECNENYDAKYGFPYIDVSRQGQLRPEGIEMLQKHGLGFELGDNPVMIRNEE